MMNIEELRGYVKLEARNYRARERELIDGILKLLNDRDLEPGTYRVDIAREDHLGPEARDVG